MKLNQFSQWLSLASSETRIIPQPDHFLVITPDIHEANRLWRSRRLLDRPLEIWVGRCYTPKIETQQD